MISGSRISIACAAAALAALAAACGKGGDSPDERLAHANDGVRRLRAGQVVLDAKVLQQALSRMTAFPIAKLGPLPAQPCCDLPHHNCEIDRDALLRLDDLFGAFQDDSHVQFTYESTDGRTFTARWDGDLICDGRAATWSLHGRFDAGTTGAAPVFEITQPAP